MSGQKGPGAPETLDGSALRIAIIHSRWNPHLITPLVTGVRTALLAASVPPTHITTLSVPGAYELPLACQQTIQAGRAQARVADAVRAAASAKKPGFSHVDILGGPGYVPRRDTTALGAYDAIVAVGVLIKGETMHFEYIADAVSQGLMRVQLETGTPVVFGVLTLLSVEQGEARAGLVEGGDNVGEEWGRVAVEMGGVRRRLEEGGGL